MEEEKTVIEDVVITLMQYLDKRLELRCKRFGTISDKVSFGNFREAARFEVELLRSYIDPDNTPFIPSQYSLAERFEEFIASSKQSADTSIEKIVQEAMPEHIVKVVEFVEVVPEEKDKEELTCRHMLSKLLATRALYAESNDEILYEILVDDRNYKSTQEKDIVMFEAVLIIAAKEEISILENKVQGVDIIKAQRKITELEERNNTFPGAKGSKQERDLEKCEKLLQEIQSTIIECKNVVESKAEIEEPNLSESPNEKSSVYESKIVTSRKTSVKTIEPVEDPARKVMLDEHARKLAELRQYYKQLHMGSIIEFKSLCQIERHTLLLNNKLHQLLIPAEARGIPLSPKEAQLIEGIIRYFLNNPQKVEVIGYTACSNNTKLVNSYIETLVKMIYNTHSISLETVQGLIDSILDKYIELSQDAKLSITPSPLQNSRSQFCEEFITTYLLEHESAKEYFLKIATAIENVIESGKEDINQCRSPEKLASYVIRRTFAWEIAAECPTPVSALTRTLMNSFKKHFDSLAVSTPSLSSYDRIYIMIMQELVKLYFAPFVRGFSENSPALHQWKTIGFILCEQLPLLQILEGNLERIKYFVNAVLSTLAKADKARLCRDKRFSDTFTVQINECEMLRKCLIQYYNKNLGSVDAELADLLPVLQSTVLSVNGYSIVRLGEAEPVKTRKATLEPEFLSIKEENEDAGVIGIILSECKKRYGGEAQKKEAVGKLFRNKISELATMEGAEIEYECAKLVEPKVVEQILQLKNDALVYVGGEKANVEEPTEKDIIKLVEIVNKVKRAVKQIEKYVDITRRYQESRVSIQYEIDKLSDKVKT